jgi:hypothetical protein
MKARISLSPNPSLPTRRYAARSGERTAYLGCEWGQGRIPPPMPPKMAWPAVAVATLVAPEIDPPGE